jgi:hypothetical protein
LNVTSMDRIEFQRFNPPCADTARSRRALSILTIPILYKDGNAGERRVLIEMIHRAADGSVHLTHHPKPLAPRITSHTRK